MSTLRWVITDPQAVAAVIIGAAVFCQWLGARLRVPSVLFLLMAGLGVGTFVDPDEVFGEILFTGVSFGVAILLFEGGTSLNWKNLGSAKGPVLRLVSIGVLISWLVGLVAILQLVDVETNIAILMAAILTVSGPTVVMPLLQVVRPREPAGSILRWEGILIDPVGASLAIVVLDAILEDRSGGRIALRIATTFGVGAAVGVVVAFVTIGLLRARQIPGHLQIPLTLASIIVAFAVANLLRPEAGLLAVTLLGMAFANQSRTPAAHIAEFNENLGATVLGVLFVVLGARVDLDAVFDNLVPSILIAATLMFIARPLAVLASTLGTDVGPSARKFLMVLAPRGVVAAAVASLFALELDHEGIDPGPLVPTVFTVVVVTVATSSIVAQSAARRLRVSTPDPVGVAIVGGSPFAFGLAKILSGLEVPTLLIGLDEDSAMDAAQEGLLAYQGRLDSEAFTETIAQFGIATGVALSGTDHLDGYATSRLAEVIGADHLYALPGEVGEASPGTTRLLQPRMILPPRFTPELLADLFDSGTSLSVVEPGWEEERGSMMVCRVNPSTGVTFTHNPATAVEGDSLIILGPGLPPG